MLGVYWQTVDRGRHASQLKTHCKKGHPYDEINTSWVKGKGANKVRKCKACAKGYYEKYMDKNRDTVNYARRMRYSKRAHPQVGTQNIENKQG